MSKAYTVSLTYDHGIIAKKDDLASAIAEKHGAGLLGWGTFLDARAQRDLEFGYYTKTNADKVAKQLKKAGFDNVKVLEVSIIVETG